MQPVDEQGYVIVAVNSDTVDYRDCARTLAKTIRYWDPSARICLITDSEHTDPIYDYHKQLVNDINKQLTKPAYLFGAHVFGQFMLGFGLDKDKIICILDNDPKKQGKRLYGTDLIVNSPKILKGEDSPIVILRAGTFTAEIEKDILENINPTAIIIKD